MIKLSTYTTQKPYQFLMVSFCFVLRCHLRATFLALFQRWFSFLSVTVPARLPSNAIKWLWQSGSSSRAAWHECPPIWMVLLTKMISFCEWQNMSLRQLSFLNEGSKFPSLRVVDTRNTYCMLHLNNNTGHCTSIYYVYMLI